MFWNKICILLAFFILITCKIYSNDTTYYEKTNSIGEDQFIDINAALQGNVAAWGDYDGDGDLDIASAGWERFISSQIPYSIIYRNDNGVFKNVKVNITPVAYSSLAWGDYNNDGLLDLAIAGKDSNGVIRSDIYKNLGNDEFENIDAGLFGMIDGSFAWGDYDNDGDLDLIVSGNNTFSGLGYTRLYKNDGENKFIPFDINVPVRGHAEWADFDNDGDLDLSVRERVYRNDGNNIFVDLGLDLIEQKDFQQYGPITWGDYDSDGDPDILAERTIFKNENGSFSKHQTFFDIGAFATNSSVFGDMDNDGDLDILLLGQINGYSTPAIRYVTNEGNGNFENTSINISGANRGIIAVGDYDSDEDLDILITDINDQRQTKVYRNDNLPSNEIPSQPTNLREENINGIAYLSWDKSTDKETPNSGLSYNIRISSSLNGIDIKNPESRLTDGKRFIPATGNVSEVNRWPLRIKESGTYYFSVQAIDNNYAGSNFSEVKQFTIPNSPPTSAKLIHPPNGDTLDYFQTTFIWSKSTNYFSDTLAYSLKIFSTTKDTIISGLLDTTYNFNGADWIIPGVKYNWVVISNDDNYVTASIDTFAFTKRKLDSGLLTDSMFVYVTEQKDTATLYNSYNKAVMQFLWEEGAIKDKNDTLKIGVKSISLTKPSTAAKSYSLMQPIFIEPKNLDTMIFNPGKIKIRLYLDATLFYLSEIENNVKLSQVDEGESIFNDISYFTKNFDENWIEFTISSFIKNKSLFTTTAVNILMGSIYPDSYNPEIKENILIPERKTAVFNEGIHWYTSDYVLKEIEVKGKIFFNGKENNPITLNNIYLDISGKIDTNFNNNILMADCHWLTAGGINIFGADVNIDNCSLNLAANNYSNVNVNKSKMFLVSAGNSKLSINESSFDSLGYFSSSKSIVKVKKSKFNYCSSQAGHGSSFVLLENNTIYYTQIESQNSLIVFKENRVLKGTPEPDFNDRAGISVYSNNYFIIHNNIINGLRSGVNIGYDNKAVIYNNTFINNENGISVYGTPDSLSIYNNIFYDQLIAINLAYSTYTGAGNLSYINNNLWKEKNPNYVVPYIDNRVEHSIIIGDSISIHEDPIFIDTTYSLASNSPAINQGSRFIPSFSHIFKVLDTTIIVPDKIELLEYYGSAPDIGAKEYDGIVNIENKRKRPIEYKLYQNYPNPFNPETTIKFSIAKNEIVSVKLFNILGEELRTLINEEKPAGEYSIRFNGGSLASGVYIYRIQAGNFMQTKKLILLR